MEKNIFRNSGNMLMDNKYNISSKCFKTHLKYIIYSNL